MTGEREVTFTFDGPGNRELPQIVGQLPVCRSTGGKAPTSPATSATSPQTTLEPPLGSGPYRIKDFAPGRSIVYEKVADYWGKDLNVNHRHATISDQIRYEYFRDFTVALEAFKGDQIDWRTENSAKDWATSYDFPAMRDKKVVKEEFPHTQFRRDAGLRLQYPPRQVQGCAVRQRVQLRLRFRGDEQAIFFGQYKRIDSYFYGTELASSGVPQGKELEILKR